MLHVLIVRPILKKIRFRIVDISNASEECIETGLITNDVWSCKANQIDLISASHSC